MHDMDRVGYLAGVIFDGLAKGNIMDVEIGEGRLSALKGEIFDLEIALGLVGVGCWGGLLACCFCEGCEGDSEDQEVFHVDTGSV